MLARGSNFFQLVSLTENFEANTCEKNSLSFNIKFILPNTHKLIGK